MPLLPPRHRATLAKREAVWGYLFIAPWILGLIAFSVGPILAVFYLSFTEYNFFSPPQWVGARNYVELLTDDPLFYVSLWNTVYFVLLSVPGQILLALFFAFLLNTSIRGRGVYRTVLYLPMVVPAAAGALVFVWLLNPDIGVVKHLLSFVGLESPLWFQSEEWSKPGIVLLNLWHIGQNMVIFLAGLQSIPSYLYEAAEVDGASWWQRLLHVTIPMLTPTIFLVLVLGLIYNFQVFTFAFIMTRGGPLNSTLFYVLYVYRVAFKDLEMGYAAALAVVLFAIILGLTALIFRTARRWVHYEA